MWFVVEEQYVFSPALKSEMEAGWFYSSEKYVEYFLVWKSNLNLVIIQAVGICVS